MFRFLSAPCFIWCVQTAILGTFFGNIKLAIHPHVGLYSTDWSVFQLSGSRAPEQPGKSGQPPKGPRSRGDHEGSKFIARWLVCNYLTEGKFASSINRNDMGL